MTFLHGSQGQSHHSNFGLMTYISSNPKCVISLKDGNKNLSSLVQTVSMDKVH